MKIYSLNLLHVFLFFTIFSLTASATSPPEKEHLLPDLKVIQKPIVFDEKREALSLEYLQVRYGIIQ